MNKWTPITLEELKKQIELGVSLMTKKQLETWNKISLVPRKWKEEEYGELGGGFWVVAIKDNLVIWYNDIEDGFNISQFTKYGIIDEYFANQDELQWTINNLQLIKNI